jgi:hypothetical protein
MGGVLGGATMLLYGLFTLPRGSAGPTFALFGAWVLFLAGWVLGGIAGKHWFRRRLERLLHHEGELLRDVEALERLDVRAKATQLAERLETGSLGWPLAAWSLIGPLTLHAVVSAVAGFDPKEFGAWIAWSAILVGHAHVVLAFLGWRYARRLRQEERLRGAWGAALGWTVLVAAIPAGILYLLPPLIVALTGLILIPCMFGWARYRVARERMLVGAI